MAAILAGFKEPKESEFGPAGPLYAWAACVARVENGANTKGVQQALLRATEDGQIENKGRIAGKGRR